MITPEATGTLPAFNPESFLKTMSDGADLMYDSTGQVFDEGGMPTWLPLKRSGLPSFLGGRAGSIFRGAQKASGNDGSFYFAEVSVPNTGQNRIHQFGGDITNGFGRGIFIHIPQRKYLTFTEKLRSDLLNLLSGRIPTFFEPKPITQ